jgi:hypothetical protein
MRYILALLLCVLAIPCHARTPGRIAAEIEQAILDDSDDMPRFKSIVDQAVNRALSDACQALRDKGEYQLPASIEYEWQTYYNSSIFVIRNIGDHKPISQWLSQKYEMIELILGRQFCITTHIAALKTFNSGIPVVFHPCTFPMDSVVGSKSDEYKHHFAGHSINVPEEPYNGVVPEAVFFAVEISCMAGTTGVGSFLCGIAAGIGEKLMATYIAPKLSDRIYSRRCEGREIGDY